MYRIFTYIHNFPTFPLQSSRNIKLTNSKYSQICTDCRKYGKYWSNFGAGRMYVHSPARHVTIRVRKTKYATSLTVFVWMGKVGGKPFCLKLSQFGHCEFSTYFHSLHVPKN